MTNALLPPFLAARSQTGASASGFSIATTASPSAGIPRCSSVPSDALAENSFRIPLINTPAFVVAVIPVLPFGRSLGVDFFDELTDLDWGSWEGSLPESSSLGGDGTPLRGAFSADASSAGIYELTAGKTLSIFAGDGDILMPSACGGLAHSGPPKWPTLSPPPSLPPTIPFRPILNRRLLDGLPLHVGRAVGTATLQRDSVIHNVAFAALRIAGLFHEVFLGFCAPFDSAIAVAGGHCRFARYSRRREFG